MGYHDAVRNWMKDSSDVAKAGGKGLQRALPRLGVLFVTSGWFRDVGLQGGNSDTTAEVARSAARAVDRLKRFVDPVFDGVLFSASAARTAALAMRDAGVDGVLLAPLMWCEEEIPRGALAELAGLPLILWTFSPAASLPGFVPFQHMIRGSGPVSAMLFSGMLRREGARYFPVVGHIDDPSVYEEIGVLARSMAIARALHAARVGVLPFPCDQMSTTWVDEFGLRTAYGVQLRWLELERVRRAAAEVDAAGVRAFGAALEASGTSVEVDGRNLQEGTRYALALERIAHEEGLSALAMNDVIDEMHASFGLRPCLCNPGLSGNGCVVSMEADVGASFAMLSLRLLTGEPPFYTEPFSADYEAGCVLMGHAGYHDAANADPASPVKVVNDIEYENSDRFTGAATFFKYRPGPVTAVNSVWRDGAMCWVCVEGESLAGPPKLEGNCHVVFKPDVTVKSFLSRAVQEGVSQHWVFVHGRRAQEIALLCSVIGVRLASIAV